MLYCLKSVDGIYCVVLRLVILEWRVISLALEVVVTTISLMEGSSLSSGQPQR